MDLGARDLADPRASRNRRLRLTVAMTHPVQYYDPWFRYISAEAREIDLTVVYGTRPTPAQQGTGFGQAFAWDTPTAEGYSFTIVRPPEPNDSVNGDHFWGLNVKEIGRAIADSRPDVVLVTGWNSITLVRALLWCRRRGVPALYRGDTNLLTAPTGVRRMLWEVKTRTLLAQFAAYLSVGHRSRDYLRHFGIGSERIFASPHCVDNQFFASTSAAHRSQTERIAARRSLGLGADDFIVIYVGKLIALKRVQDLIVAASRSELRVRLIIVGTGPEENALRLLARQLSVDVTWAGFLNQSELGKAYALADCLVLPSASETWGLVVNEAMATGLPCIVSDRVGCAPDLVVSGSTGKTFPAGDQVALADAIRKLRNDLESGIVTAGACRARVARYSFREATEGIVRASAWVTGRRTGDDRAAGVRPESNPDRLHLASS